MPSAQSRSRSRHLPSAPRPIPRISGTPLQTVRGMTPTSPLPPVAEAVRDASMRAFRVSRKTAAAVASGASLREAATLVSPTASFSPHLVARASLRPRFVFLRRDCRAMRRPSRRGVGVWGRRKFFPSLCGARAEFVRRRRRRRRRRQTGGAAASQQSTRGKKKRFTCYQELQKTWKMQKTWRRVRATRRVRLGCDAPTVCPWA